AFLRNYRLKRAAQILTQDGDSVTQVAYAVGFNNLSYFAKCFRELYDVSPTEFKEHVNE
ncbi:MAG: helix-turn-helix transcriptional regulator, partial [Cyclobacteriaceae bacterium]